MDTTTSRVAALQKASGQILSYLEDGRLLRGDWESTDERGRRCACLLAVLAPQCGEGKSAAFCPAAIMPPWFSHVTVWINDSGSAAVWPRMVRRYAGVVPRWHVLRPNDWARLQWTTWRIAVDCALPNVGMERPEALIARGFLLRAERDDTVMINYLIWPGDVKQALEQATKLAWSSAMGATSLTEARVRQTTADMMTADILDAIESAIVAREGSDGHTGKDQT